MKTFLASMVRQPWRLVIALFIVPIIYFYFLVLLSIVGNVVEENMVRIKQREIAFTHECVKRNIDEDSCEYLWGLATYGE